MSKSSVFQSVSTTESDLPDLLADIEAAEANAVASAASAAASAASTGTQAANATQEAANAAASAVAAANSATAAADSEVAAGDSATDANNSASTASGHANTASAAATTASGHASDAFSHKTDAETAETNALASQTAAAASATAAGNSETAAGNSETAAGNSATAAGNSATAAGNSATAAGNSATAAGNSETNAANSATAAGNSATAAGNSATAAGNSATAAANSATDASNYATTAENHKDSALTAQSAAESARDSALSALDSFDDRYLGVKSSDPSVDNDGNALVSGALYFNSSTTSMKVYDGSNWLNAYASLSGALLVTNNLSDLNNAATARTNLGLAAVASSGDLLDLGITDGTNGQALKTDGAGNFAFGDVATSTAWADITGKPTTISGFGITDAFDGAYSSLTGTPDLTNYITNNVGGDFTVDNGTLFVDSSSNRVGINLGSGVNPSVPLNVAGTVRFQSTSGAGSMLEFTSYSGYTRLYRSNGHLELQGGNTGNGVLQLSNSGGFTFDGNDVLTSASTIDAATLDGIDSSQFLRSDAADTMTQTITMNTSAVPFLFDESGHTGSGKYWRHVLDGGNMRFDICTDNDGLFTPYTTPFQMSANGSITSQGYTIWHGGNDGSGSGLDADLLDGVQGSSYLRSDASDTFTGTLTLDGRLLIGNDNVSGQGDNNTHFNYQGTGVNYIRGTTTYFSSPVDIFSNNITIDTNKGFSNSGAWTRNATPSGYIEFGPANTSYGHIYTDRAAFYFNKAIYSTGNIVAYASDERLKENIKTIEGGLDKVCQLRGVTFDWRDDCEEKGFTPDMKTETGFIAQEVRNVLPEGVIAAPFDIDGSAGEGVSVSGEDYLTVNSQKIIPLLVEAIKELKAEIEELKKG